MARRVALLLLILSVRTGAAIRADVVRDFLHSIEPAQLGSCVSGPEYLVLDTWRDRSPRTIVASYLSDSECSRELAVFRVHRNGSFSRLATSDCSPFKIELLDVTGNGVPEILVTSHPGNRSATVEILKWDGLKLTMIGETSNHAIYFDLNGDGALEIIEPGREEENECGAVAGAPDVKRLVHGRYVSVRNSKMIDVVVLTKTVAAAQTFVTTPFLPDQAGLWCRIRIINGTQRETHRATKVNLSVRRSLRDREEPYPGRKLSLHATGADEYVDEIVELPSRCTLLDVSLEGPEGAEVAVVIDAVQQVTP